MKSIKSFKDMRKERGLARTLLHYAVKATKIPEEERVRTTSENWSRFQETRQTEGFGSAALNDLKETGRRYGITDLKTGLAAALIYGAAVCAATSLVKSHYKDQNLNNDNTQTRQITFDSDLEKRE